MEPARILELAPPRMLQDMTRPWAPARGDRVVAAVSGGADSVALACLLAALAPGRGWTITLATVDHGLRGAAGEDDARFVVELGARLDLPTRLLKAGLRPDASEAEARTARYRLLEALAAQLGARALALAHTMDDQAETLLFRICRGSGSSGRRAMRRENEGRWRPLLATRREDLRTLLVSLGQEWREDETNLGPQATRNRVRHVALPALERALGRDPVPGLARSAELAEEDELLLERLALEARNRVVLANEPDGIECDVPRLRALDTPLRARVLRRLLGDAPWFRAQLTRAHLDALDRLVRAGGPGTHADLPGVCAADRKGRRLILAPLTGPPRRR